MAATLTPIIGGTNGRAIKVAATTSPGTSLHLVTSVAGQFDEVTIYAYNGDTVARELTLQCGGTTTPDDDIKVSIAPKAGLHLVLPGRRFNGGVELRAYAATANVITCHLDITRYAP